LGSIPVRVHFAFLMMAILFGLTGRGLKAAVAWLLVVFVSILVHELGHALAGMAFGLSPQIDIHGMGGTTSWTAGEALSPGKRIVVSLAGPFIGFALGVVVVIASLFIPAAPGSLLADTIEDLKWVNFGWGVFNLLPMLPLDGGNVMASALQWITGGKGQRAAHYVSIVVAGLAGLAALYLKWIFPGVLAALYIVQNVRGLSMHREPTDDGHLEPMLAEGFAAIAQGEGHRAIALGEQVVSAATNMETRRKGLQLLAQGRLLEGHWASLMQLLEAVSVELGAGELQRFEQAARELDRPEEAARIREWMNAAAGFRSSTP
jgi:Zn-dependent protease